MRRPLDVAGGIVYSSLVRSKPGSRRERLHHKLRSLLVRLGDPTVTFDVAGTPLQMPLSHDLPLYLARFPLYSANLGRLATACAEAYPDLAVVDVGANVGDSLAFIRHARTAGVLCVEGEPRYLRFLRANAAPLGDTVSIVSALIGRTTGEVAASYTTVQGTGGFRGAGGESPTALSTVSLDDLLAEHPLPGRLKLLKSDTDGFEAHVLGGGLESLRIHRPVLFLEYHPQLLAVNGSDGLELLRMLHSDAGYSGAVVYDNFGELLLSTDLADSVLLEELHRYYRTRGHQQYLDLAVFHTEDAELFELFVKNEHEFYRNDGVR